MPVILLPSWLLADSNVRAWGRWPVWVREGEICSGAALGWTGCPEEALWSKRLGGDSRAAKAPLPGPKWSCMRCLLRDRPLERGWGEPLPQGWKSQVCPRETGSSGENLSVAVCSPASLEVYLCVHGTSWLLLMFQICWGRVWTWVLWVLNDLKRLFHFCAVILVAYDNYSANHVLPL